MTTDPIAAARALIAAQPALLFRCDLCSDEGNCHPHHDMSMSGEHILCDQCEDFDNPGGVPDPLTLIATLADALEAERAENQRLREALRPFGDAADHAIESIGKTTTLGVLGALAPYFVTWQDFNRARAALRSTEASHDD